MNPRPSAFHGSSLSISRLLVLGAVALTACDNVIDDPGADAGVDGGRVAVGADAGSDGGMDIGGVADAGLDAGAGFSDAGLDAGARDSGLADAGLDASSRDSGVPDSGVRDAGLPSINAMACTPDGSVRTIVTPATAHPLYIGAGGGGLIGVSTNGQDWETVCELKLQGGDDNFGIRSISSGDGKFLAVGGSTMARIMVSYDGLRWEDRSVPGNWLGGVAWGNGRWVGAGGYGQRTWSTDGLNWPASHFSSPSPNIAYRSIMFGGGTFIAYGDNGRRTLTTDGETWTNDTTGNPANNIIVWLRGQFFAGGADIIQTSPNGITWSSIALTGAGQVRGFFDDGTDLWALTSSGMFRSTNGASWTRSTSTGSAPPEWMESAIFAGGRIVGVSYDYNQSRMRAHTSSDFRAWSVRTPALNSLNSFGRFAFKP